MSLDNGVADAVRFHCGSCGSEHTPRQLRNRAAICQQCQGNVWNMVTEYREVEATHGFMAIVTLLLFGPILGRVLNRETKTIQIDTPEVPAEEAMAIVEAGFFKYRKWAFKYMELRRQLDGERDRQVLRQRGGVNCKKCNMFFMPAPDKAWTQEGYCSKRCSPNAAGFVAPPPAIQPATPALPRPPVARPVSLTCTCGHQFQVPAMYVGILRPCPSCNKKIMVS